MHRRPSPSPYPPVSSAILLPLCLFLGACGSGTIALFSSGSSDGEQPEPRITDFTVEATKQAPARIRFFLAGSGREDVRLFYRPPGGAAVLIREVRVQTEQETSLEWDFSAAIGVPLLQDVEVWAALGGEGPGSGNSDQVNLGNLPPEILEVTVPAGEQRGVVPVGFRVADLGGTEPELVDITPEEDGDIVRVYVQYRRLDGDGQPVDGDGNPFADPDDPATWTPAAPAAGELEADGAAFASILAVPAGEGGDGPGGTALTFFWDSAADLGQEDRDVALRVFARDSLEPSAQPFEVQLPVDNNEEPIALIGSSVVSSTDRRGGIPVPLQVFDEEGDEVRVALQWSRTPTGFPPLGADPWQDPEGKQLATRLRDVPGGRVLSSGPDRVALEGLTTLGPLVAMDVGAGLEIELHEPRSLPQALDPNGLAASGPAASVVLEDGRRALLLDNPGGWRLREVDLGTGQPTGALEQTFPGGPASFLELAPDGTRLFVGVEEAGVWSVRQYTYPGLQLVASQLGEGSPTINGMAARGRDVVLVSAGSRLWRVDLAADQPEVLLEGLEGAWGVALDPLLPDRFYLAERAGSRVRVFDLPDEASHPVLAATLTVAGPEAIAVTPDGTTLLVVVLEAGARSLRAYPLGGPASGLELAWLPDLAADDWHLETGPEGRIVLVGRDSGSVLTGGGIQQRRVVSGLDVARGEVTVSEDFAPLPSPGSSWRLRRPAVLRIAGAPQGASTSFVWDSRDVPGGGRVFLKATPVDTEWVNAAQTDTSRPVASAGDRRILTLPGIAPPDEFFIGDLESFALGDLDTDGDLDLLVGVHRGWCSTCQQGGTTQAPYPGSLSIYRQDASGGFPVGPEGGPLEAIDQSDVPALAHPLSLRLADVDLDGTDDIVCADFGPFQGAPYFDPANGPGHLHLLRQTAPGVFDAVAPTSLEEPGGARLRWVEVADLDGDGQPDLLGVSADGGRATIWYGRRVADVFDGFESETTTLSVGLVSPFCAAVGDWNHDGAPDVVLADQTTDELSIWYGPFVAGTSPTRDLALGDPANHSGLWRVRTADLDGDGRLDLIAANKESDDTTVWYQNPPGSAQPFGDGAVIPVPPDEVLDPGANREAQAIATGDVDADGRVDIVVGNGLTSNAGIYFQTGPSDAPVFVSDPLAHVLNDNLVEGDPRDIELADLDGDGDLDIVLSTAMNAVQVFHGDEGQGYSDAPIAVGATGLTSDIRDAVAADLDGDGDLDLVTANSDADAAIENLTIFAQIGTRSLGLARTLEFPGLVDVAAVQLDGDVVPELAVALPDSLVLLDGFGAELDPIASEVQVAAGQRALTPAWLGAPVLVTVAQQAGSNVVTVGVLGLELLDLTEFAVGDVPGVRDVRAADLDADGLDELLLTTASRRLVVLWGDGDLSDGLEAEILFVAPGLDATDVAVGDWSGDGVLDLAVLGLEGGSGSPSVGEVSLWVQVPGGDPAFPSSTVLEPFQAGGDPPQAAVPTSLCTLAIGGPGGPDLAVGLRLPGSSVPGGSALGLYRQLAPGTFLADPQLLTDPLGNLSDPDRLQSIDVDGDGTADLVAINPGSNSVTVHLGGD